MSERRDEIRVGGQLFPLLGHVVRLYPPPATWRPVPAAGWLMAYFLRTVEYGKAAGQKHRDVCQTLLCEGLQSLSGSGLCAHCTVEANGITGGRMSAPAGWYPQPDGLERYWDGTQWTAESRSPAAQVGGAPATSASPPPSAAQGSGMRWLKYAGAGFGGLVVGLIMGTTAGSTAETAAPAATVTLPAPAAVTETVEVPVESTVTVTAPTAGEPAPAATTSAAPPVRVTVPDAVGMNYQDAQDLWRSSGLIVGPAVDATGANRLPVLDLNWVVLEQEPAAGEVVDADTMITATVKKYTDD